MARASAGPPFGAGWPRSSAAAALVTLGHPFRPARPDRVLRHPAFHRGVIADCAGRAAPACGDDAGHCRGGLCAALSAYSDPMFQGALVWTGLAPVPPLTADFQPLFPWLAPMLAGVATGAPVQPFQPLAPACPAAHPAFDRTGLARQAHAGDLSDPSADPDRAGRYGTGWLAGLTCAPCRRPQGGAIRPAASLYDDLTTHHIGLRRLQP